MKPSESSPSGKRSRRALGVLGAVVAVTVTFVAAAVAGVVVHLDAPATRRLVAARVNAALGRSLEGRVEIERIGRLGLLGLGGVDARVYDPDGVQVLAAVGARGSVRTLEALRSALLGGGPIHVVIPSVGIDYVDVNLDRDPSGELRLAAAFRPKPPSSHGESSSAAGRGVHVEAAGRGVHVEAAEVTIARAWAHGTPSGDVPVDAELSDLAARAFVDPATVGADVDRVRVLCRALPRGLGPRGTLGVRLRIPIAGSEGMELDGRFDGDLGGIPVTADGRVAGSRIDARLDARDEAGAGTRALLNEVSIREAVSLHAEAHGELPHLDVSATLGLGEATVAARAAIDAGEATRVRGTASARRVDLAALFAGAPRSDLGLDARADLSFGEGGPSGEIALGTLPGRIGRDTVPRVEAEGRFRGASAELRAWIREARMPTEIAVDVSPRPDRAPGRAIAATLRSRIPDLRRVPKVGDVAAGSADLRASARLTLPEEALDATADVKLRRLSRAGLSAGAVDAHARAIGTVDRPILDATLDAKRLLYGGVPIDALTARARVGFASRAIDVHAEVDALARRRIEHARAVVDLSARGRAIDLDARAEIDGAGSLALRTERLVLGGEATDLEAWRRARGRVHLVGELDMGEAWSLLPPRTLPLGDLRGLLTVEGRVGRDDEGAPPELRLHAHTRGLYVLGPAREPPSIGGVAGEPAPRWRSAGVDLGLDVRSDGASGLTTLSLRATDPRGSVLSADAKALLPRGGPRRGAFTLRDLLGAPMSVKVVVPPRRLDQLPGVLGVHDARGEIAGELDASGTILDPRVRASVRGRRVRLPAMPPGMKADPDVAIDYDGARAKIAIKVSDGGRELLDASGEIDARVRDAFARRPLPWRASARARLASFPLESIPALADRQIKGDVTGEVALEGLHEDARLDARIDASRLSVGGARYTGGTLRARAGDGELTARVRLGQDDGYFDARARAGLRWGAELTPSLDDEEPASGRLLARAFRAAALQPFVQGVLPALDGRIDADASAELAPGARAPRMQGRVELRGGTLQVAALGEELRHVRASATLASDGRIEISDIAANGINGELRAAASARLEGLHLAEAAAEIRVPRRRAFDVTLGGQPIGQVSGVVMVRTSAAPDRRRLGLVVEVPRLVVALPQVSKKGLQRLGQKENVRVGVYLDAGTFVELPLDEEGATTPDERKAADRTRIDVDLRLGDVVVERGNRARVRLTGNARISAGAETKIAGRFTAIGGWIDVQGKRFDVEKGTVTFNEQAPTNPIVVATAAWTAADGTRVYAEFVGPLETGRVTFRSDPPRPKNEILALVLFGTTSGATPGPSSPGQPDAMRAAVGLGGGFAAQGLTEALDDLAGVQATARVDTTRSSNPRPEVELQIDPKVTIRLSHVLGTPPVTEPDKNLATVDYRFHRNWSLETTVGDHGKATVDAIWQRRY